LKAIEVAFLPALSTYWKTPVVMLRSTSFVENFIIIAPNPPYYLFLRIPKTFLGPLYHRNNER
jgi:hypothetical protein